ncbi:Hypothetical protein AKI40_1830 [Enterobacter sp. FY-07]|nr:Hypothetical protein AKI40_1830 [Enterobacter sp. FY-07]
MHTSNQKIFLVTLAVPAWQMILSTKNVNTWRYLYKTLVRF